MKILLVKFRNIGDVLLSTPLLANLHHHYPGAAIDFAVNDFCAPVLACNPHVRRLLLYRRSKRQELGKMARLRYELSYLRAAAREAYDLVINLTEGDRGTFLAWFSRPRDALGFPPRKGLAARSKVFRAVADDHVPTHTVNKDLQFLTLLCKTAVHKRVAMCWSDADQTAVEQILRYHRLSTFLLVHPVARWMFKCWDAVRFARVIDHIQHELGIPVVVTASPEPRELAHVRTILSHCRSRPLDLGGRLTLGQLACLADRARLFLGVDSAPMHIAAAMDTPVVALFGRSEPLHWGPWDNALDQDYRPDYTTQRHGRHAVIQKGHGRFEIRNGMKVSTSMLEIETDEVVAQLHQTLAL
jgi:heptosyltransferase-3